LKYNACPKRTALLTTQEYTYLNKCWSATLAES
jgi:hypothetical protein